MVGVKFVGFFSLIGGAAVLVGNFIPKLSEQYPFLIWAGAGVSILAGLIALSSRRTV